MGEAATRHQASVTALAGIFLVSGVIHLVRPEFYEPIMPKVVPAQRLVIHVSGIAELACAAGLLAPRTRRAAGWASTALLLIVYPANVKMASDATRSKRTWFKVAAFARLPMQLPMLRTAWRAAHGPKSENPRVAQTVSAAVFRW